MMEVLLTLIWGGFLLHGTYGSVYHIALLGSPPAAPSSHGATVGHLGATSENTPTVTVSGACTPTVTINTLSELPASCEGIIPTTPGIINGGLKVESAENFTLHVIQSDDWGNTEGYLALEDDQLGTEYHVTTYCTVGGRCQFSVTAIEEGTSVFVKFKDGVTATSSCPSQNGVPFTLNELDVLYFESSQDLTGTVVKATRKIGVFVGTKEIPGGNGTTGGYGTTSFMIEQLIPADHWGDTFYVLPGAFNHAGDLIKITTRVDNTLVDIRGFLTFVIQRAGDSVERRIDWEMPTQIRTSNPVQIIQILNVDLYSQTGIFGYPSMVLVQAEKHWSTKIAFICDPDVLPNTHTFHVIAMTDNVPAPSRTDVQASDEPTSVDIAETDKKVWKYPHVADPEFHFNLPPSSNTFGGYGYCAFSAAMLMGIDLVERTDECVRSPGHPGDDRDNNCNEQIDEETCTAADSSQSFTLQEIGNPDTIEVLPIDGIGSLDMHIKSCGLMQIRIASSIDQSFYDIQITPGSVTATQCLQGICDYGGSESQPLTTPVDCTTATEYRIEWGAMDASEFSISVVIGTTTLIKSFTTSALVRYDQMELSSLVFESTVQVDIMTKDCAKIVSSEADNYGVEFMVPVADGDVSFQLVITPKEAALGADVTVMGESPLTTPSVITKSAITASSYDYLRLSATEEISVYLYRTTNLSTSGLYILPEDVLGPGYFTAPTDSLDASGSTVCAYSLTSTTTFVAADPPIATDVRTEMTTLTGDTFLLSNQPIAVFRETAGLVRAQMPPRETLGTKFFIPQLPLTALAATAKLRFIAAEDGTVVIIRGEYDNIDTVTYVGASDILTRALINGRIYNVTSNKAAQLQLEITDGAWKILLVIPPVQQYKAVSQFPAFGTDFTFISSSGVNADGVAMPIAELPDSLSTKNVVDSTGKSFFYLTFLADGTANRIVVPSDSKYADINEPCVICRLPSEFLESTRDCDCDGLVKEETCTDMDTDIDGSINEDCAYVTEPTFPQVTVELSATAVDCSVTSTPPPTTTAAPTTSSSPTSAPGPITAPTVTADQPPTFSELTSTGQEIISFTTPSPPANDTNGATEAPVAEETCTVDCVCPCGWVNFQNYTQEELEEEVKEIQEKLKINKMELSSLIRKKTSAQDDRPSARAVGSVGIIFFVLTMTFIVLLDLTSLARDLRLLRENLKSICPI